METVKSIATFLNLMPDIPSGAMTMPAWMDYVDRVEAMLARSFVDKAADMKHRFADGMYIRECDLEKGDMLVSIPQKKSYSFLLVEGSISVRSNDGLEICHAPYFKIIPSNTRRIVCSLNYSRAITHHPTDLTSVTEIQESLWVKRVNPYLTKADKKVIGRNLALMNV